MKALTGNLYFKTKVMDNQLVRTAGHCRYGAPDFGECFATSWEIPDGDWEAWIRVWTAMGDRLFEAAEKSAKGRHRVSAREGYLKAAEVYRTAGFALLDRLDDPRDRAIIERIRESFTKALGLFSAPGEPVEIPCGDLKLPGYFLRADNSGKPKPTLIFNCGYHGIVEEVYFWGGASALERGYNVLAFDGPGQGHSLHRQRTVFRPDWETVVTPVIDFALKLPEVDGMRLVGIGRSFGAWLAARAATAEHRFAALIADPGEFDQLTNTLQPFPKDVAEAFLARDEKPMADYLADLFTKNADRKFYFISRMLAHGAKTPVEYIRMLGDYSLAGLADKITCPTLVTAASHDDRGTTQPQIFFDALTCPKTLMHFSAGDGAGDHCESGAPSLFARDAYDWLDETLGYNG